MAVRYDGGIYVETGFSRSAVERLGRADMSSCDDGSRNPRGLYFAEDPVRVAVWSLRGYDPAHVVGVRVDGRVFGVLVTDALPDAVERDLRRKLNDAVPR